MEYNVFDNEENKEIIKFYNNSKEISSRYDLISRIKSGLSPLIKQLKISEQSINCIVNSTKKIVELPFEEAW